MENHLYEGNELKVNEIISLLSRQISLAPQIWKEIEDNRKALDLLLQEKTQSLYGINTGFGSLYSIRVSPADIRQLQTNLLRSHACGVGPAVPASIVKLTLLLKIISLSQGLSAVRREVVEFLIAMYNSNILPVVPTLGSLGAS